MDFILTTYSDLNKIEHMTIPLNIHIYMEVIEMHDKYRISKIKGLSKMPICTLSNSEHALEFGTYELGIREEMTPLTIKYREKYEWFEKHIEFKVPFRTGLYFHIGNYYYESDGCELVGNATKWYEDTYDKSNEAVKMVLNSSVTFKPFYELIYGWLKDDKKRVFVHIV